MVWVKKDWTKKPWPEKPWPEKPWPEKPWPAVKREWPSSSSSAAVVAQDFPVDGVSRHLGTVTHFSKCDGCGYIWPKDPQVAPGGTVWVTSNAIQSLDRYPFLMKNMDVEFNLVKWTERGETTLRAIHLTLPGGGKVSVQEQEDSMRVFFGGRAARYAGKLKSFEPAKGFGYIALDENIAVDPELGLPQEVCVETAEVNCGGRPPKWMDNIEVEFGIYKSDEAWYMAHNMTLPGGRPITDEHLLNRVQVGEERYRGAVTFWRWAESWGLITVDAGSHIPERVQQKLEAQEAKDWGGPWAQNQNPRIYFSYWDMSVPFSPEDGMRVSFNLYVDDQGAGATNVAIDVQ